MEQKSLTKTSALTTKKSRRNEQPSIQRYRIIVQSLFTLICIWIGVEFYFFVRYLETAGAEGSAYRPPGVEGFLPISSLISLYHFFLTGEIHPAHPAGLFILLAAIAISLFFAKSFCAWVCPFGQLSQILGDLGEKIFRRKIKLPRWLDYPMRSLKYLLLAFFVYSIFFLMTTASLRAFLDSPYNIVADIKMYYFFGDISRSALIIIAILFFMSIIVRNFWCRYLCPYGALLGVLSLLSPVKIKRNIENCIDCEKCAKVCPALIEVDKVAMVLSDECTGCLKCVDICPVRETLELKLLSTRRPVPKKAVAFGIVGLFVLTIGLGMVTGNWRNNVKTEEYLHYQKYLDSYGHPTGGSEIRELNKTTDTLKN